MFDTVAIAKAMRTSYGYHTGDHIVVWEEADPDKQAAWLACAEAAVEVILTELENKKPV